jgi:hypothetical protein
VKSSNATVVTVRTAKAAAIQLVLVALVRIVSKRPKQNVQATVVNGLATIPHVVRTLVVRPQLAMPT